MYCAYLIYICACPCTQTLLFFQKNRKTTLTNLYGEIWIFFKNQSFRILSFGFISFGSHFFLYNEMHLVNYCFLLKVNYSFVKWSMLLTNAVKLWITEAFDGDNKDQITLPFLFQTAFLSKILFQSIPLLPPMHLVIPTKNKILLCPSNLFGNYFSY